MTILFLFIFGMAMGSFLNVLAVRYDPGKFLFHRKITGGRSRCPRCKKTLRWFELIPVASFIVQKGRCRNCGKKISIQYPLVEILSGLIFVLVPWRLAANFYHLPPTTFYLLAALWLLVFLTILLISLIDLRLSLIPDEANLFLVALGAVMAFLSARYSGLTQGCLSGDYAAFFGLQHNVWVNHFAAAALAAAFFAALILLTKGRGMGVGDLKLAGALGFVFGWPGVLFVIILAFISGAVVGVILIIENKKNLKSAIPFGPFLALSSVAVFFFGTQFLSWFWFLMGG